MKFLIMGGSWSVGAWHTTSHYHCYHDGVSHYLRDQGHSVTVIGQGGSSNISQLKEMQTHTKHRQLNQNWDHIIWLWSDCLRNHHWYRKHQKGVHNIYHIHENQEQWVQDQITKRNPDLWSKIIMIGGSAPLYTDWPCKQLDSWAEAMGYIEHDHPHVDQADWRDFVNWCCGKYTYATNEKQDYMKSSVLKAFIRSFSHDHKQHHMDFLKQSEERYNLLVYGDDNQQYQKGMMGEDLHPNPEAHAWLTEWILNKIQD
jgi:hypothetical protein|tara:strand:- start:213 stop:983 length:771 start_codon:yes stop_codon:yes gene_type:complete